MLNRNDTKQKSKAEIEKIKKDREKLIKEGKPVKK